MLDYYKRNPRIKKKKPLSQQMESSVRLLIFTIGSICVICLVIFFLITNFSAQKGYYLQQIQTEKEKLLEENKTLNEKILEVQTYAAFAGHEKIDTMVKAESPVVVEE